MRSAVALLGEKEVRDIVAEQGKIEVGGARGDTVACFTPEGAAACTARDVGISTVYLVCVLLGAIILHYRCELRVPVDGAPAFPSLLAGDLRVLPANVRVQRGRGFAGTAAAAAVRRDCSCAAVEGEERGDASSTLDVWNVLIGVICVNAPSHSLHPPFVGPLFSLSPSYFPPPSVLLPALRKNASCIISCFTGRAKLREMWGVKCDNVTMQQ